MNTYTISKKEFLPKQNHAYIIGIDPGTKNGVAIYDSTDKIYIFAKTFEFWELFDFLSTLSEYPITYVIVIEDIIANKPTFQRGMLWSASASKRKDQLGQAIGIFDKLAQDVGGNKRDEHHILEWFHLRNIPVMKRAPKKNSKTKLAHDEFMELTHIKTRLNEHTRDAIMLIYTSLQDPEQMKMFEDI